MKSLALLSIVLPFVLCGCDFNNSPPESNSGVKQAVATVTAQSNGLTVEQENIKRRVESDNKPGSIKYLYVISPYTGDVIIYSTVKGKVTSGGKRLSPTSGHRWSANTSSYGFEFAPGKYTNEMIQDDGTYGSSSEYVYWWDVNGEYNHVHQGAGIIYISSVPRQFGRVILNLDIINKK